MTRLAARTTQRDRRRRDERGFALVAVLLVLALLGVIGTEFVTSTRLEASMARSFKERIIAAHLAEAGVEQAIREILTSAALIGHPEDGPMTFYKTQLEPLPRLPREKVPLGSGEFSYRITDETSRFDLNRTAPDRMNRLLALLGLEKEVRDVIVDSMQDWRDPNDLTRLNGAESDYYLKLPIPYRARNANFEDIRELLQVRGITRDIYYGHDGQPGLRDFVTVSGNTVININTAPPIVLAALGLAEAEINEITHVRREAPYPGVPGRFAGRGLSAVTRVFRVDAQGLVGGEPHARVIAIVSRVGASGEPEIVQWDPNADIIPGATEAGPTAK